MKADEVFRDASLEEAFHRMSVYKERKFGKDTTLSMKFEVDTATSVFRNMPNRWLMSSIHTGLQDYIYTEIHQDVSLPVLDSIYAHMLDSVSVPRWLRASPIPRGGCSVLPWGKSCIGRVS